MRPIKAITVQGDDDFVIKISDRGNGMTPTKADEIWKWKFHHKKAEEDENGEMFDIMNSEPEEMSRGMFGYGCGMPLSKLMIENMNGKIEMQSIQGFGTDVIIRLPYPNFQKITDIFFTILHVFYILGIYVTNQTERTVHLIFTSQLNCKYLVFDSDFKTNSDNIFFKFRDLFLTYQGHFSCCGSRHMQMYRVIAVVIDSKLFLFIKQHR